MLPTNDFVGGSGSRRPSRGPPTYSAVCRILTPPLRVGCRPGGAVPPGGAAGYRWVPRVSRDGAAHEPSQHRDPSQLTCPSWPDHPSAYPHDSARGAETATTHPKRVTRME